jgi:hypothetical protein
MMSGCISPSSPSAKHPVISLTDIITNYIMGRTNHITFSVYRFLKYPLIRTAAHLIKERGNCAVKVCYWRYLHAVLLLLANGYTKSLLNLA